MHENLQWKTVCTGQEGRSTLLALRGGGAARTTVHSLLPACNLIVIISLPNIPGTRCYFPLLELYTAPWGGAQRGHSLFLESVLLCWERDWLWLRGWGLGRQGDVCRQRDLSRKWDVSRQRDAVQGWGLVRWRRLWFRLWLRGSVTVNILLVSLYRTEIKTTKYRVSLKLLYVTVNILLVRSQNQ